jgi:hypothetical protein
MKKFHLLLLLLIAQFLIGCSDNHPESVASNASVAAISAHVGANGLIDSCSLVDKTDVENLIGGQFSAKSGIILTENKSDLYEKSGDCKVISVNNKSRIYFTTFVAKDENSVLATYKMGQDMVNSGKVVEGIRSQDVIGLGGNAYMYNYSYGPGFANRSVVLVVLAGRKLVQINMDNFPEDTSVQFEKIKNFAAKVIKSL